MIVCTNRAQIYTNKCGRRKGKFQVDEDIERTK